MFRAHWFLALLLTCLATGAGAGAWMREPGATFLSFGADIGTAGTVVTAFAETGITPRLTLGADAWRSYSGDWSVLAVANVPLGPIDRATRIALGLGVGAAHSGGKTGPQMRLGAHLGRGLDTGWLASDLTVTHRFLDGETGTKITGTWGYNLSDDCATILEARAETGSAAVLAPSLACRVTKGVKVRIGGAMPVGAGGGAPVIGLQTWLEF